MLPTASVTGVGALAPAAVVPVVVPEVAQAAATLRGAGATATPRAQSTARGGWGQTLCWALWGALRRGALGGALGRGLALLLVLLAGHLGNVENLDRERKRSAQKLQASVSPRNSLLKPLLLKQAASSAGMFRRKIGTDVNLT